MSKPMIAVLRFMLPVAVLMTGSSVGHAATDVDVRAGFYSDVDSGMVGGGVLTDFGNNKAWFFNPNLEYVPADRGDLFTFNGDFHYDLKMDRPYYFWLGGGPAVIHRDPGLRPRDRTDLGANLIAGIGGRQPDVRPFGQVKLTLSDDTEVVLMGGVRF